MPKIVSISLPRFHERDAQRNIVTKLPLCALVLLVSIPAALLTVVIMGCVHAVRFVAKLF